MARTKEFDTDAVVTKAMDVFWSKGFEATSIQDLVEAMGINRGSIYDTFGDKAGLFTAAIERYQADAPSQRLLENADNGAPREEIEMFFTSLLERAMGPGGRRGCLLINSIAELAIRDDEIAGRLGNGINKLEDALYTLIKRGQKAGDMTQSHDARVLARSLLASAQGLIILSKTTSDGQFLKDISDTALALLD